VRERPLERAAGQGYGGRLSQDQNVALLTAEFDAAATVVSALYWDRDFRRAAKAEVMTPGLFLNRAHGILATLLVELGDDVDESRVLVELDRRKLTKFFGESLGGVDRDGILRALYGGPHTPDPAATLVRMRELTALRSMRYKLDELTRRIGANECGLGEASTELRDALTAAAQGVGAKTTRLGEAVQRAVELAHEASQGRGTRAVITGFPQLDDATGGIRLGSCWVMGASTNWGKSTTLVLLYLAARAQGFRPLIVSGEDPEELYARRVIGRIGQLNPALVRDGKLGSKGWARLLEIAAELRGDETPFVLNCQGDTAEVAARKTRGAIAADGIDFVLVDYLQVWRAGQRGQRPDRRVEVSDAAGDFTDAIKTAKAAGVLFSQLTIEQGEEPSKDNIRESRDVGHRAEAVVLGWTDKQKQRWLLLDKNKDGPCPVRFPVYWDPHSATLVTEEPDPQQQDLYGGE